MASNTVEVTLQFVDKFTDPMNKAIKLMEKSTDQAKKLGDEIKKAEDKIKTAEDKIKKFSSELKKLINPLGDVGDASINMSNVVDQSMSYINISLNNSAKKAEDWARSIKENYSSSKKYIDDVTASQSNIPEKTKEKVDKVKKPLPIRAIQITNTPQPTKEPQQTKTPTTNGTNIIGSSIKVLDEVMKRIGNINSVFTLIEKIKKLKKGDGKDDAKYSFGDINFYINCKGPVSKTTPNGMGQVNKNVTKSQNRYHPSKTKQIGTSNKKPALQDKTSKLSKRIKSKTANSGIKKEINESKLLKKEMKSKENASKSLKKVLNAERIQQIKNTVASKASSVATRVATKATNIMKIAQLGLNAVFSANPLGLVIAGVVALIAILIVLYKRSSKFRNIVNGIGKTIKSVFGGMGKWFSGIFEEIFSGFKGFIDSIISKIPKPVVKIVSKVLSNIGGLPMLAKGTNNWGGGLAITQERGGEIMDLPRGTRVYPHDKSIQMAREEGAKSGRSNIAITISKIADKVEIRNDKDIESLANKVAQKILTTIDNTGKEVFA